MDNHKELLAATEALKAWFRSQDLSPADSMMIIECYAALMICKNSTSTDDTSHKLNLVSFSISHLVSILS